MATIETVQPLPAERVHYFPRQLLTADDMRAEQEYFRERLRRHNRFLHGWGIVTGCLVEKDANRPWGVQVGPGYLITPAGDEINITASVPFDLAADRMQLPENDPCAGWALQAAGNRKATQGRDVLLAACYRECNTHPVRVHPAGCGCDDALCEYSRTRDSFALVRIEIDEAVEPMLEAIEAEKEWIGKLLEKREPRPPALRPKPFDDNCVVLATITLPASTDQALTVRPAKGRRALPSVQSIWDIFVERAK